MPQLHPKYAPQKPMQERVLTLTPTSTPLRKQGIICLSLCSLLEVDLLHNTGLLLSTPLIFHDSMPGRSMVHLKHTELMILLLFVKFIIHKILKGRREKGVAKGERCPLTLALQSAEPNHGPILRGARRGPHLIPRDHVLCSWDSNKIRPAPEKPLKE